MKNSEKNLRAKRNLVNNIRNAVIILGISSLLLACWGNNDESNTTNQDSIDSAKAVVKEVVDTTAIKDTTKKVEVSVKH